MRLDWYTKAVLTVTSTLAIDMHNHIYPAGTQQGGRVDRAQFATNGS
jgi:hypothetical protein